MNIHEKLAWRNFMIDSKLKIYEPISETYIQRLNALKMSTPESKELMKDGWEKFQKVCNQRILNERKDDIFFNRCPKCNEFALTPKAKQCRYCYHQWHDKKSEV